MDAYEMTHLASMNMEEVSYSVLRSFVKFQHHTGWKTNDLDLI